METNIGEILMLKFICYNWMPTISDHVLDLPESFYNSAGTSRLHSIDQFNPYVVKDNDLIFVKTDFIVNGHFQQNILNKIYKRFNLITGVSSYHLGRDGGDNYKTILNHPNLNKWFCTNPPVEHSDKIVPIPIGFQEPDRPGGNQEFLSGVHNSRTPFEEKRNRIFLPYHTPETNSSRKEIFNYLKSLPFVDSQDEKQSLEDYYKSMDQYKFVIGLEGSGPDIHRNYEAMLVGSVPINKKNIIKTVFDQHGAKTLFLGSWESLDENMLKQILKIEYNIKNNDEFLKLENHISLIRKLINARSN
tara:strand:+ start:1442 stop:2350 length:909 start_codon:yes stop_codon:yes gene_type:complete